MAGALAVAAGMLACGARTDLGGRLEAADATSDHASDAKDAADAKDGPDAFDAPDSFDASDALDAPDVYDGPFALCGVCSADLNANETWIGPNDFQGAQWLAYELPVACDQLAAWIAIHDDTAAIRVYADDDTGRPGAEIVPPTPTQESGDAGWFVAKANVQLTGGQSYWVATSIVPYFNGGTTHTAWSVGGTVTRYWGSFQGNGGNWQGPYTNPPMIRAGDCP